MAICLSLILTGSPVACQSSTAPEVSEETTPFSNQTSTLPVNEVKKLSDDIPYFSAKELDLYQLEEKESSQVVSMTRMGENVFVLLQTFSVPATDDRSEADKVTPEVVSKYFIISYSAQGERKAEIALATIQDENSFVVDFCVDTEEKYRILIHRYDPDTLKDQFLEYILDDKGTVLGEPRIVELPDGFSLKQMRYDSLGNKYFAGYQDLPKVLVYDQAAKKIFDQTLQKSDIRLYYFDGKMYADGFDVTNSEQYSFYMIDLEKKAFARPIGISFFDPLQDTLIANSAGLFLASPDGLSRVDLQSGSKTPVLSWTDSELSFADFSSGQVASLTDTSFLVFTDRYDSSRKITTATSFLLEKADKNPNSGKTILTIAGVGLGQDEMLSKLVYDFNTESKEYFVELRDYFEGVDTDMLSDDEYGTLYEEMLTKLHLDIVNGSGPDIIYGDISNFQNFEANGLLADMYTLIEKDTNFKKGDILPIVYSACETDGKLYKIGAGFSLFGIVVPKSIAGDRNGWTFDEFTEISKSLPEGQAMLSRFGMSQSDILQMLMESSLTSFLNEQTGEVRFNSDEFRDLIGYAKENGRDDDIELSNMTFVSDVEQIMNHEIAASSAYIESPVSYHMTVGTFGEPISLLGYPSAERKGPSIRMFSAMAICANSASQEACWSLVKCLLSDEIQEMIASDEIFSQIPVMKTAFDWQIEKAKEKTTGIFTSGVTFQGEITSMTEENEKAYREMVENSGTLILRDRAILKVIMEEAPAFFNDEKTAEEVIELIQNRVEIIVQERQ
jgi:ABC-type glycerol-3-phosphate transport system substrate-binding protein